MASERFLITCESFYSIQGEGASSGKPAVFLRLSGCNLRCSGFSYKDPKTGEHLGCDTKQLWQSGTHKSFVTILDEWRLNGWLEKLNQGAHLVITGGEPLLQQPALDKFIKALDAAIENTPFIEIETNATIKMSDELFDRINQFNLSPKLLHSGETSDKAYISDVLNHYANSNKSNFKFVIATKQDVDEVLTNYVKPLKLDHQRIWLMPEGGTLDAINAKKAWLVELCKVHCFNFSSRLQIDIWHEVVGV